MLDHSSSINFPVPSLIAANNTNTIDAMIINSESSKLIPVSKPNWVNGPFPVFSSPIIAAANPSYAIRPTKILHLN